VLKNLIIFNTIQDMLVEVASTTYADMIKEILIDVIYTPFCTPK